jgi:hypothetical protein
MSSDVEIDAPLQKQVTLFAFVFAALMVVNAVLNISFMRSRHAKNDRVANENVEIDSRIEEAKKIIDGTHDLLRQANELNERAEKIEAALSDSKKPKN